MREPRRYQERPSRLQIETYRSWDNVRKMPFDEMRQAAYMPPNR